MDILDLENRQTSLYKEKTVVIILKL